MQSKPGVGATIKHFCCNNQEDNRFGVNENVSERTLREIYLRGFAIAVKESDPLALMTSYNQLNGAYTGCRRDLITDILRCEWGYTGLVMTDWGTKYDPAAALHAQTDLMMAGCDADRDAVLAGLTAALYRATGYPLAVRSTASGQAPLPTRFTPTASGSTMARPLCRMALM